MPNNAPWTLRFLAVLADTGDVAKSAKAAGISQARAYRHRRRDESFAAEWDDTLRSIIKSRVRLELQQKLLDRAIDGWVEPVFSGGKVVGAKRRFDHRLAILFLERHMPEVYGRTNEVVVDDEFNEDDSFL